MLRQRNTHHIGNYRGNINGAQITDHNTRSNRMPSSNEGSPHINIGIQVLYVRYITMLAEEGRACHQRSGSGSVELIGWIRKDNQVTGASGMRHIRCAAGSIRDITRLGFREDTVDHHPAFGLAITAPVVWIAQPKISGLDRLNR